MTDEDVVRRFRDVVGIGTVAERLPRPPGQKMQWAWSVSSREHVQAVAAMFWGFLGARRRVRVKELLIATRQVNCGRTIRPHMGHAGGPCARVVDHGGKHRSLTSIERSRDWDRARLDIFGN
jgi:hypothetical protein